MNCLIIDDEYAARAIIRQLCKNEKSLQVAGEFSNAIQAIKYLNQNKADLIFLDIHMPDFTGFDLIQTLKKPPKIILITSDRKFALDAFEYECIIDYLVKPITLPRFLKAVEKVKKFPVNNNTQENQTLPGDLKKEDHQLYINIDRRLIKIEIPDINIVEAKGDYILIKTNAKNYTVHSTLKKIEDKLPNDLFLKVHRSYIINLKKIIDIEDNSVLIGRGVIPVSRSNRSELMKKINLL